MHKQALLPIILLCLLQANLYSQAPTACGDMAITGSNHTLVFYNAEVILNGDPLPIGSHIIATFNDNGTRECGGYALWEGTDMTLAAYGDDGMTAENDGFTNGEVFGFRVELPDGTVVEETSIQVEYEPQGGVFTNQGTFGSNGISGIKKFSLLFNNGPCPNALVIYPTTSIDSILHADISLSTFGEVVIDETMNTAFKAEHAIDLMEGFEVELGGIFLAEIEECEVGVNSASSKPSNN